MHTSPEMAQTSAPFGWLRGVGAPVHLVPPRESGKAFTEHYELMQVSKLVAKLQVIFCPAAHARAGVLVAGNSFMRLMAVDNLGYAAFPWT